MSETADIAVRLGISPDSTMGYSYSGGRVTLAAADTKWTWAVLHPWTKATNLHAFFSHPRTSRIGTDGRGLPVLNTPMGCGSAGRISGDAAWANFWSRYSRTYLPGRPSRTFYDQYGRKTTAWLKPGMAALAAPGTSVHEDDTYQARCLAVDAIGWEDGHWAATLAGRAQLLTFIDTGNEPWHSQPAGYRKSKSQLQADLAVRPLPTYPVGLPKIPLAAAPPTSGDEMFYPIQPVRNSDTRPFGAPPAAHQVMTFGLAEMFPANTIAVAINVTVLGNGQPGYVTVWPEGPTPPPTSTVNMSDGRPAAGSAIVGVVNRGFQIRSTVPAHLIVDVTGYWTS